MATNNPTPQPFRAIRAKSTRSTITVYQAFSPEIAEPALRAQKFVPPFSRTRMTWIKPSFLWMAYRCGWASKPNQERVLAIEITREGFEWALKRSCLSHVPGNQNEAQDKWRQRLRESPVRVQWDPERDLWHQPLGYRSIQIGLSGEAVERYVDEWIVSITDVTGLMGDVKRALDKGDIGEAEGLLPVECVYPLSEELRDILHAT
ncbi:hypothetical protein BDV36DRAFT_256752 [Aspergillus pseudocaelatus]|uniref:DUF4291 domain-containing protein n=1 Tax=Aspergillus pseudocaelatus TaxID=1825620 RepID=A0ABQ6WK48_9EURO|nr:hypothetical protein BDV36DRAFT_256752 [Aspergillus pseudocaelatus]